MTDLKTISDRVIRIENALTYLTHTLDRLRTEIKELKETGETK